MMIKELIISLASIAIVYCRCGIAGPAGLLIAAGFSYALALLLPKRPKLSFAGIVVCAAYLLVLRLQPAKGLWLIPTVLGSSYFTLQIISYLTDVSKGKYPPEKNFLHFFLYISYLPHLFMGPIERYDEMLPSLKNSEGFSWANVSGGAMRIGIGLAKKYLIAARTGVLIGAISSDSKYSGAFALAAMLLYSLHLFCDFSGGIDIVLGVSRILGIKLPENFERPFSSETIKEFWRRWHITLGSWLKDYIYIPLGGNRKGKLRRLINLLISFLVSGIWHGKDYILWGLCHGLLVSSGDALKTSRKSLNRIITCILVSLLWCFFIWEGTLPALKMLLSVFTRFNYGELITSVGSLGLNLAEWLVLILGTALLLVYELKRPCLVKIFEDLEPGGRIAAIGAIALIVLVFGMYGIGFDAEAFIYSRF